MELRIIFALCVSCVQISVGAPPPKAPKTKTVLLGKPTGILILNIWAPSSEFVSSSIPSWQILTAHSQPFRGASDLAFCLKVPLESLLVWASSEGSGETARMCRLAWTFAARIGDKYQMRLTRSKYLVLFVRNFQNFLMFDFMSINKATRFASQLNIVISRYTHVQYTSGIPRHGSSWHY